MISGYKTMWVICMFDLPVNSVKQQRAATKFRNFLIKNGMFMKQFSVYLKFFDSFEKAKSLANKISPQVPPFGRVTIIYLTDKQFGLTENFYGNAVAENEKKPLQLQLF